MGNKLEELEAIVQWECCDTITISEIRWDNLHSWSAVIDGCKFSEGKGEEGEVGRYPCVLERV